MTRWQRIVLIGSAVVLAYEVTASYGAQSLGFPYWRALYGTWVIYCAVAFLAVRATNSIGSAALAAAIVGLVEATLGWGIAWLIGPGRTADGSISAAGAFLAIGMVTLVAGSLGAIVGLLARQRVLRSRPVA